MTKIIVETKAQAAAVRQVNDAFRSLNRDLESLQNDVIRMLGNLTDGYAVSNQTASDATKVAESTATLRAAVLFGHVVLTKEQFDAAYTDEAVFTEVVADSYERDAIRDAITLGLEGESIQGLDLLCDRFPEIVVEAEETSAEALADSAASA